MITHAIPGRIRFRHGSSLPESRLDELIQGIRDLAPSSTIEINPGTGSILIRFPEKAAGPAILKLLETQAGAAQPPARQGRKGPAWPHMRHIKRGLAVSLAASLGLLAVRRDAGHAVMGGVFLGLLARHVWVYRKRMWK